MALSPEMLELKSRCLQALSMGASLARVETYLAQVGAGPVPAGLRKEQHLLDALSAMEAGASMKAELIKVPPPPAPPPAEPVQVEETVEVSEATAEVVTETKKSKRNR